MNAIEQKAQAFSVTECTLENKNMAQKSCRA